MFVITVVLRLRFKKIFLIVVNWIKICV
jgi:hypothetical protein